MRILLLILMSASLFGSEIAVVSMAAGGDYRNIVEPGIHNKEAYCALHGYDFILGEEILDPSRPPAWSKVLLILQLLNSTSYKWIFWIDADALFMNFAQPLEDLIDEQFDFILTRDFNNLNSGVFFLRNCDWSVQFLHDVYSQTQYINHMWWENMAIIVELKKLHNADRTKVYPQREMNSYLANYQNIPIYQPGDFILHFAGERNKTILNTRLTEYAAKTVYERCTLDHYLSIYNFQVSPRLKEIQKKQFVHRLKSYPDIKSVLEIGLNGGHSVELFFQTCPHLNRFVSFDNHIQPYTQHAATYLRRKYNSRFTFTEALQTSQPFDLIYIEGNEDCLHDILNCAAHAHLNTKLWINDYNGINIKNAVDQGVIRINHVHWSKDPDGDRCWVEAEYLSNFGNSRLPS